MSDFFTAMCRLGDLNFRNFRITCPSYPTIKPYTMSDYHSLVHYMDHDCPYWIERSTAQQRYNISNKKWRKLQRKKTYVVRIYGIYDIPTKYWEPDIQRMLECDRTGRPYTKSELLPLYESRIFRTDNSFIYHYPIFWHTLCLLACWTAVPTFGFYHAGFAVWNIVIASIAGVALLYSTRFGDYAYIWFMATYFPKHKAQRIDYDRDDSSRE